MDVRLPNGYVIKDVLEGTSKDEIMRRAVSAGIAERSDFHIATAEKAVQNNPALHDEIKNKSTLSRSDAGKLGITRSNAAERQSLAEYFKNYDPNSTESKRRFYQGRSEDILSTENISNLEDLKQKQIESEVAARYGVAGARGLASGLSFGASDYILPELEDQTTGMRITEGVGDLFGSILTAHGIGTGYGKLIGKLGKGKYLAKLLQSPTMRKLLMRTATAATQTSLRELNGLIQRGELTNPDALKRALGNLTYSVAGSAFSVLPEQYIPAEWLKGTANYAGQVISGVLFDVVVDLGLRDRLKNQSFREWFFKEEIPQLALNIAFAHMDFKDPNFKFQQGISRREDAAILRRVKSRIIKAFKRKNIPKVRPDTGEPLNVDTAAVEALKASGLSDNEIEGVKEKLVPTPEPNQPTKEVYDEGTNRTEDQSLEAVGEERVQTESPEETIFKQEEGSPEEVQSGEEVRLLPNDLGLQRAKAPALEPVLGEFVEPHKKWTTEQLQIEAAERGEIDKAYDNAKSVLANPRPLNKHQQMGMVIRAANVAEERDGLVFAKVGAEAAGDHAMAKKLDKQIRDCDDELNTLALGAKLAASEGGSTAKVLDSADIIKKIANREGMNADTAIKEFEAISHREATPEERQRIEMQIAELKKGQRELDDLNAEVEAWRKQAKLEKNAKINRRATERRYKQAEAERDKLADLKDTSDTLDRQLDDFDPETKTVDDVDYVKSTFADLEPPPDIGGDVGRELQDLHSEINKDLEYFVKEPDSWNAAEQIADYAPTRTETTRKINDYLNKRNAAVEQQLAYEERKIKQSKAGDDVKKQQMAALRRRRAEEAKIQEVSRQIQDALQGKYPEPKVKPPRQVTSNLQLRKMKDLLESLLPPEIRQADEIKRWKTKRDALLGRVETEMESRKGKKRLPDSPELIRIKEEVAALVREKRAGRTVEELEAELETLRKGGYKEKKYTSTGYETEGYRKHKERQKKLRDQIRQIKRQAKLEAKLEKALQGKLEPGKQRIVNRSPEELKKLKLYEFAKKTIEQPGLKAAEKERLQKQIDAMIKDYEYLVDKYETHKRETVIPEDIARLKQHMRDIKARIRTDAKINEIDRQLASGDLEVTSAKEKFENKSLALMRKEAQLMAKRRQLAERRHMEALKNWHTPYVLKAWGDELVRTMREAQTMADISASGRQMRQLGMLHPVRYLQSLGKAATGMWTQEKTDMNMADLMRDSRFERSVNAGIEVMDTGKTSEGQTEFFESQILQKIPGVRNVANISGRAFAGGINYLRLRTMYDYIDKIDNMKIYDKELGTSRKLTPEESMREMEGVADLINVITGSGHPPKGVKEIGGYFLFAPRFMWSKPEFVYKAIMPAKMGGFKGRVARREAIKSLLIESAMMYGIIELAQAFGWDTPMDPDSSDFMKLVNHRTGRRWDLMNGYQQPMRLMLMYSMATGRMLMDKPQPKNFDFLGSIGRYLSYKGSPLVGSAYSFYHKKNLVGERRTRTETGLRSFTPISLQTTADNLADYVPLDNAVRKWWTLPPPDREPQEQKIAAIIAEMTGGAQSNKYFKRTRRRKSSSDTFKWKSY